MIKNPLQRPSNWDLLLSVRNVVFYILFFLYVWLWIDPVLYYQFQEPVFLLDLSFFKEFLNYPGGLVEYLSAFLSQFYYYPWIGALIITLIAIFIGLGTKGLFNAANGGCRVEIIYFVPSILLLVLHNHYQHPIGIDVGLLFSLICFNLYVRFAPHHNVLRLILYLFLIISLHYITGGPFLLFALLCGLFELLIKRRILGLSYILFAGVLPYIVAKYIFIVSLKNAYFHLLPLGHDYQPMITPYVLYLFFPLIIIFVVIGHRLPQEIFSFLNFERHYSFALFGISLFFDA